MKKNSTKKKSTKPVKKTSSVSILPTTLSIKKPSKNLAKTPTKTNLYYQCLNAGCPGKNITQVAQQCKANAPALLAHQTKQRKQEINKIKQAWKQIGLSLSNLMVA